MLLLLVASLPLAHSARACMQLGCLTTHRRLDEAAAKPAAPVAKPAAPAAKVVPPVALSPAFSVESSVPAATNSTGGGKGGKHKGEKHDRPPRKHRTIPGWFIATLCAPRAPLRRPLSARTIPPLTRRRCLLGLVVPAALVLMLAAHKRRTGGSGTPGAVSTTEPMEEGGFADDNEPDSPRHDPFASAFAAPDEVEEERQI